MAFQDMYLPVPQNGFACTLPQFARTRTAIRADLPAIIALDHELTGLERPNDFRYFLDEQTGMWQVQVLEGKRGRLDGTFPTVALAIVTACTGAVPSTPSGGAELT